MRKSTLLLALGGKPDAADENEDVTVDDTATEDKESALDAAIDTFLDPKEDADVRREAFKQAIKGCMDNYK